MPVAPRKQGRAPRLSRSRKSPDASLIDRVRKVGLRAPGIEAQSAGSGDLAASSVERPSEACGCRSKATGCVILPSCAIAGDW